MADGDQKVPQIVLLKSEVEAAAARVAERALNETWTGAAGFIGDVFGGLVGDRVKQWRTRNLVDALAKTKEHLEAKGVSIENAKSLPVGELLVIFEGASKTDDVDLSSMWGALLSNGMNPKNDTFIDPSFPRLLSELSGLDARIISYINSYSILEKRRRKEQQKILDAAGSAIYHDEAVKAAYSEQSDKITLAFAREATIIHESIMSNYSDMNVSYSLSNLIRLGLITGGSGVSEENLLNVELGHEEVHVDASGLMSELRSLWDRFDLMNEDNKTLPKLSFNNRWSGNAPSPHYSLTGLATRFLAACS